MLLTKIAKNNAYKSPVILFLTGSSGCGKTHLCSELAKRLNSNLALIQHFDRIGVPPLEQIMREYGSGEKWQAAKTREWIAQLSTIRDKILVVFEGQYHPAFVLSACRELGFTEFKLAVVTCDEAVWEARLRGPRKQTDLVNDDMRNWARVLKQQTIDSGGAVIDTSASNIQKNLADVAELINLLLLRKLQVLK